MKFSRNVWTLVATLALAGSALAAPMNISGVKVEDSATVAGAKLQLNGAGIRYKAIFKVYVAELYTSKKVATLEELVAAPGPKRMAVTMLRDIDARELGKLLTRGMEDNASKTEMSKLVPGLIRMGAIFSEQKNLKAGDRFEIDWIPGKGSVITVKGEVQGEPFVEADFFKALMSIWLGSVPADYKLKDNLLGMK
ncbi:MAG: chalcone isomerase family protein [Rhodoferax sp.]|nr:chalcone isomerase family protein [Rhodoferax sp.]